MLIAIFSGSFNPVHQGHVRLAEAVLQTIPADEVWMIVSPQNPLKDFGCVSEQQRLEMLQLAIADHPQIKASDIEFYLPRPSYTIDTLRHLKQTYPHHRFVLVIGSDNALIFDRWKDYDQLLNEFEVYIYPRPGYSTGEVNDIYPLMHVLDLPVFDISSTAIREAIKMQKDTREWLDPRVKNFIQSNKLYR